MRVDDGLPAGGPRRSGSPAFVTIGNFDGVHRGHRGILERNVAEARAAGGEAGVVTFDPHPRCVLQPEHCPAALTTLEEKTSLLEEAGIDRLVVLRFDLEMSRWPAEEFCSRLLAAFDLRRLRVGNDFALGHRRRGDIAFLRTWGEEIGVDVEPVAALEDGGSPVSSTRVRSALAAGDMATAAALLGRTWFVDATLIAGERGPALIVPGGKALPAPGAYAVQLRDAAGAVAPAVAVVPARLHVQDAAAITLDTRGCDAALPGGRTRCEFLSRTTAR